MSIRCIEFEVLEVRMFSSMSSERVITYVIHELFVRKNVQPISNEEFSDRLQALGCRMTTLRDRDVQCRTYLKVDVPSDKRAEFEGLVAISKRYGICMYEEDGH